jgi:hypothetical protein
MNIEKKNKNTIIKYESYWRNKNDKHNKKDSLDTEYPYPKEGHFWTDKEQFLDRLTKIEKFCLINKLFENFKEPEICILCKENIKEDIIVGTLHYTLENIIWKNSLVHYILKHNIKPSNEFRDFIYQYSGNNKSKDFELLKIDGDNYMFDNIKYLKVNKNQLLILDALMIHGGYNKKYFEHVEKENLKSIRYSEHAGLLDFDQLGLDKIIISAKTNRVDKGDDEIYLPKNMKEYLEYEYMFHTHPPTPTPGGRAISGILYDFPSINDIFHFIDHFNLGQTQGSLVVTPEGLYNIRKLVFNKEKINIYDEGEMINRLTKSHNNIQSNAIKKYTYKFSLDKFYNEISKDFTYIDEYNKTLHEYEIHIDYFPRIKDKNGNWYLDSIYLPVIVQEKI